TVRDPKGAVGSTTISVNVQNAATSLSAAFTSPTQGATVSGTVSLAMAASGGSAPYTYTLSIDGTQVASSGSNTYAWNTTTASNGGHSLGLTVRDAAGATATATLSVTVQNGGTGLSAAVPPAAGRAAGQR